MSDPLDAVFRPRAVAVVGASQDPTKRGYQVVRALQEAGYAGRIQPVNPRGGELLGLPVTRSIAELDPVPDLALVSTPAATVPQVIEECAARGIRAAVVLALGFAESGEAGALLEQELHAVAKRTGVRVVGPNTSGILNMPIGLNLIGARGARAGGIALLAQSGNMALSLLNQTANGHHEGISICVGAGNQVDLGFADYLRYLNGDENTRAIAMYVEGLRDGRAFFEAARDPARQKPIVLLKGGRSTSGQSAARSHTGAVAGEYAVVRAALAQAGVIEVQRTDELFAVAETLAWQPALCGGIAILSDGGGHATLSADALSDMNAPLAVLSAETQAQMRALLGPNASVNNPIDMANAADAAPRVFVKALEILLRDGNVGGVMTAGLFGGYALRFSESLAQEEIETAHALIDVASKAGKPLVVYSLYAGHQSEALDVLRRGRVPVRESLEVACRCVAALAQWGRARVNGFRERGRGTVRERDGSAFAAARYEDRPALLETEVRELVERGGVQMVDAKLCRLESEVVEELHGIQMGVQLLHDIETALTQPAPHGTEIVLEQQVLRDSDVAVVLKVMSPSIVHKSDVGGVRLDISDADAAVHAFRELMSLRADVRGVMVSPMLRKPNVEVLVGARRDAQFGPIITVGLGGIMVELQRAVAIRVLPIDRDEVESMLDETVLGQLLKGVRGQPPADRKALVDLILNVGDIILANPDIADLECNPVFVYESEAIAVDARVLLEEIA